MLTAKLSGFLVGTSFAACIAADAGDDFSNNLFSDLAPLLALFGERVTTQFMSQSMGWADNIILAMAPLGIITAIVGAIRVGGPSWLKTIIGRARENRAVAEAELMSSTSHEVCELWNGQEVVRVMGVGPIREFIILMAEENADNGNQLKKATGPANAGVVCEHDASSGDQLKDIGLQVVRKVPIVELKHAEGVYLTEYRPTVWGRILGSRLWNRWSTSGVGGGATKEKVGSGGGSPSEPSTSKEQISLAKDPEKALPMLSAQRLPAPGAEAAGNASRSDLSGESDSGPKQRKRLVAVVRNTAVCAPNLTLNVHSQISRRELYAVATIGIALQLGVLVFSGIAAKYLTFILLKDGNPVASYAFPCTTAGTLLLVASMLLCAYVVESSTSEVRYRPADGMEARVVWLQRSGTVNDQAFESFAIFPAHAQAVVTTSRRAPRRELTIPWWPRRKEGKETKIEVEELTAVIGAIVGICGFIVQFIGLRGMHWSASVAQLGSTIIMTILRASVRRNLAKNPQSQPLLPGHEMDWLALALGDCADPPWLDSSKVSANPSSRPWDWRVVSIEDPRRCEKLSRQSGTAGRNGRESTSHRATSTRRDLGALADWYGPASADAIALARAIEVTLNALDDLADWRGNKFTWSLPAWSPFGASRYEPIAFRVERQDNGNWVTFADEIEAALSLWLYSVHELENPQRSIEQAREGEGGDKIANAKPLHSKGDEWLRSKGSPTKLSLRLLGSYDHDLSQDLRLWMPDGSVRVIGVQTQGEDKSASDSRIMEVDKHRIVGYASGWRSSISSDAPIRLQKIPFPDQDYEARGNTSKTILATESYGSLQTLFVQHMFATFMWVTAKTMEKPIVDKADVWLTEVGGANEVLTRRSFALRTARLSKLAQDVHSTGLGSLEEVYLGILPPLSMEGKLPQSCKHMKDMGGRTPLHFVAAAGSEADVKRMVELGADIDVRNYSNETPLHVAISRGNIAAAGMLLKLGADTGARTSDGWTPLTMAARHGHVVIVEELIRLGADKEAETSDGWTPFVLAARYGHTAVVEAFINLGVSTNAATSRGWSPLFQAASEGEEHTTRALIKHGADKEVRNLAGRTPLHGAASKGANAAVRALVELGADIEAGDNFHGTPLHWAAVEGHEETARVLVELGANKQSKVSSGWMSHYEAVVAGDQAMKAVAGEEEGSGRQTPLHLAAWKGHVVVVRELVELGADKGAKDDYGRTPLDWAVIEGRKDVVQLLT